MVAAAAPAPARAPVATLAWLLVLSCHLATSRAGKDVATPRSLPSGSLILGYATCCNCGGDAGARVIAEAERGVNVINWFAANLASVESKPVVSTGLNTSCIAQVADTLRQKGLATSHILTVGGWDAPHPNTTWNGATWAQVFDAFNKGIATDTWPGFDGIDWDLEGYDDPKNPNNYFSLACISMVGEMSQALKRAGYLVTMVPPESYLDVTTSKFDLSLLHAYPEWHREFKYHGHNCYAIWLTKYGKTGEQDTFDLVDIQIYESWAHAGFAIDVQMQDPAVYLSSWIRRLERGWEVDFSSVPDLKTPSQIVRIAPDKLIVGFSFGGTNGKTVYVAPTDVGRAWGMLGAEESPRGVMFWNINLDGGHANGTNQTVSFSAGFNSFLHVR